jgi:hypothetical protein
VRRRASDIAPSWSLATGTVEYPGYPVITLRPIEGLEFVEETVAAVGCLPPSYPAFQVAHLAAASAIRIIFFFFRRRIIGGIEPLMLSRWSNVVPD